MMGKLFYTRCRKVLFATSLLLCFTEAVLSQSQCVYKGLLLDSISRLPITGASITYPKVSDNYDGNSAIAYGLTLTNEQGYFETEPLSRFYLFYVSLPGTRDTINVPAQNCDQVMTYYSHLPNVVRQEVVVSTLRQDQFKLMVPASVGTLSRINFNQTDQTSLQNAVNTVPGVIMESRGFGGSHRLSIRGSALRSPFAVRNIKMYLDGIPLTSPDGHAPLEMIDPAEIESLAILKGPTGSIYGSGNGGVLLFKSARAYPSRKRFGTQFQFGSYNIFRTNTFAEIGFRNGGLRISHTWQDNQGYRKQEFNHKNQITVTYNQILSNKQKILFYGTFYDANWGLPGGLNPSEVEIDPRQAIAFSVNNNAKLVRSRLMGGLSHTWRLGDRWKETTSIYAYSTSKTNPYGTSPGNSGYKDEGADGYGGRTDWSYSNYKSNFGYGVNFGGEWQSEAYHILENKISIGQPADFKYLYDIGYIASMAFVQANVAFKNTLFLNVGGSYNVNNQDVRGRTADGFVFDTIANWQSQLLPRLSLSVLLPWNIHVYRSVSAGNANPTVFEMIDYENNTFNLSLQPERGINHEWGFKQNMPSIYFSYEISAYHFVLNDMITAYQQIQPNDASITKYHNAAQADQKGIEWLFNYTYQPNHDLLETRFWTAGSVFHFIYDNYQQDGRIFNGNKLPGVPLVNMNSGVSFTAVERVKLDILHYWFDRMPLNNENTVWAPSYHLINMRASCPFRVAKVFELALHTGINNLFNEEYSSFYNLNAFANRYFNPSPGRNYYFGFSFTYEPGFGKDDNQNY